MEEIPKGVPSRSGRRGIELRALGAGRGRLSFGAGRSTTVERSADAAVIAKLNAGRPVPA
jgi:hypothetical protein